MEKQLRSYKIRQYIDRVLSISFLFVTTLWLIQSICTLIVTGDPFVPVHLWIVGAPMHVTTALSINAIYIINYLFFRTFLPGHLRVVRALLFTILSVVFYDLVWSICCIAINSYGSFILPLTSTSIVIAYLLILNKQSFLLTFKWKFIIPAVVIYLITLAIFINSGFFQQFALMEQGLGPDPHGWEWLLNKTVTLWMWFSIAQR